MTHLTHTHTYPLGLYLNQRPPTCAVWECCCNQGFLKGEEREKREKKVRSQMRKEETEVAATTTGAPNSSNLVLPAGTPIHPSAENPRPRAHSLHPSPPPSTSATPTGLSSLYPSSLSQNAPASKKPSLNLSPLLCSSPFLLATPSLPSHLLVLSCRWRTGHLTQVSLLVSVT